MSEKKFKLSENDYVTPCPKCKNNTEFTGHSQQVAEDHCNVWVVCKCGYDPTENDSGMRFEDVWGSLDKETLTVALSCWNDAIPETPIQSSREETKKSNDSDIQNALAVFAPDSKATHMEKCDALMDMAIRDLEDQNHY